MGKGNILEVENLSKSFQGRSAVDNISLTVETGDIFGFLGPNGSGKTTTIRLLLRLIYPQAGRIRINGYDLNTDFYHAIEKVGAIVETPKFYPYLSGRKNLELMGNLIKKFNRSRVDEVLEMVGLSSRAGDKVGIYSLGMKQRLGIANALLSNPRLVILDEPTNGLDPQGMKEIRELILRLASIEEITFFISTHMLHEVEQICNKAAIIHQGKTVMQGSVESLLNIATETIEVCTSMAARAVKIIAALPFVKEIKHSERGMMLQVDRGHGAEINRLLVASQIDVEYLIPHKQSLEDRFIELTKGEH